MKKQTLRTLSLGFFIALSLTAPVAAVESDQSQAGPVTPSQAASQPAKPQTTLKERLEKRKAELKTQLTAAQQQRVKTRCKPAQAAIKVLDQKVNANVPNRIRAYEELSNHLPKLITKLKAKGVDVTTLEQQQETLKAKVAAYKADADTYKQALADLNEIDCAADTTGFKASLESVRTLREKLSASMADITKYVKETIKPALQQIRTQLEAQSKPGGEQ